MDLLGYVIPPIRLPHPRIRTLFDAIAMFTLSATKMYSQLVEWLIQLRHIYLPRPQISDTFHPID